MTFAGIALLIVAIGLLVAEAHVYSHGVLGAGGIIALVFAGLLLFDTGGGGSGVRRRPRSRSA